MMKERVGLFVGLRVGGRVGGGHGRFNADKDIGSCPNTVHFDRGSDSSVKVFNGVFISSTQLGAHAGLSPLSSLDCLRRR
jgi:hypothetical protein